MKTKTSVADHVRRILAEIPNQKITELEKRIATLEIQNGRLKQERDAAMEDAWKYRDLSR